MKRTGSWEWEVPTVPSDFHPHSLVSNCAAALQWLAEGSLRVEGLAEAFKPSDAQEVYAGLMAGTNRTPCAIFDWRS